MKLNDRTATPLIYAVSAIVAGLVALLLYAPKPQVQVGFNIYVLPLINACLNSTVAVLLVLGYVFIRRGQIAAHRWCMLGGLALSVLFLLTYVSFHALAPATRFGDEGVVRYVYYFILLTHIPLAAAIVPLALFTVYRAWQQDFAKHKKIARYTFPLWLYVAITGVLVYLFIAPYYPA